MKKLRATVLLTFISFQASGTLAFYEDIEVARLSAQSESIVLVELISGAYDRDTDKYRATLVTVSSIKGNKVSEFSISHQHGWNRLEKLGGYYLIYLDSNKQLVKTGSAIVPINSFGGPFSDVTLEEAAVIYELPEGAWFTAQGRLWALANCLVGKHPTCTREKELIAKTFNMSSKRDAASGAPA